MLLKHFMAAGFPLAYAPPSLCAIDGAADTGGGGDGGTIPADERSAASAIEGLLDREDGPGDGGDNQSSASAQDAGPGESQATGEEEGHSEPGADGDKPPAAAIEPPKSWSDEDKALFGKLPPEAQATIARRESERDQAFNRRTQEIAEERKGWEAERTAIQGQRQQYVQSLQQLVQLAVPEAEALARIDWQQLSITNPAEFVRLSAQRDALRERVGRLQGEMQRVQQQEQSEIQQRRQAALAEQQKMLVDKIPEFGDPAKAKQLGEGLRSYLGDLGFSEAEIGQAADHRLIMLARDGMLYRQADAARKAAEAKRQNPPPVVQRAGTAQQSGDGVTRQVQAQRDRLVKSGRERDAIQLLEMVLPD